MIHVITLNPSIDNNLAMDFINFGKINDCIEQKVTFEAKAVNVAFVLKEFKIECKVVTASSPEFNLFAENRLRGLEKCLIYTEIIRMNTKINQSDEIATEISSCGNPLITSAKSEFENYVLNEVKVDDFVVLTGNSHQQDYQFMIKIAKLIKEKTQYLFLDNTQITTNDLEQINPFFFKINVDQLRVISNEQISRSDVFENENIVKLAQNISHFMVTMGEEETIYLTGSEQYITSTIDGEVKNTSCVGDSIVAAVVFAVTQGYGNEEILKIATATGYATMFSESIVTMEEIVDVYKKVKIEKIN